MKFRRLAIAGLLVGLIVSTMADADQSDSSFTLGIKHGTHKSSLSPIDDGTGSGLMFGINFDDSISVEMDYLSASLDSAIAGRRFTTDIQSLAAYTVYRSTAPLYGFFKFGLLLEYVDNGVVAESDLGLSLGLGAGYRMTRNLGVELEYTRIETDVDFVGGSVRFSF